MNAHVGGLTPLIGVGSAPTPKSPPRVLFVGISGDPGSDRIVADMGELGAQCAVVAPKGSFPTRSRYATRVFPAPNARWAFLRTRWIMRRLEAIAAEWKPDLIAPLDEIAAVALRDPRLNARIENPAVRRVIAHSLGDPRFYATATSRRAAMRFARSLGLSTPREVDAPDSPHARWAANAFGYPVVVKRDLPYGGRGAAIASNEDELQRKFGRLWRHAQAMRLAGWIPGYRSAGYPHLTVQEFIPGSLACRVAACADGRELEGADFLAVKRDSCAGPIRYLSAISQPEMAEASRRFIAALRLSGVVSLDFILTPRGEAHFFAFHLCPAPIGHLGQRFGHDIHAALLLNLGWRAARGRPSAGADTIALFPQAIDVEPRDPDLEPGSRVFHDVPWDDPEVLAAYRAWLDERHPGLAPVIGSKPPTLEFTAAAE